MNNDEISKIDPNLPEPMINVQQMAGKFYMFTQNAIYTWQPEPDPWYKRAWRWIKKFCGCRP